MKEATENNQYSITVYFQVLSKRDYSRDKSKDTLEWEKRCSSRGLCYI
uniref:Uncharacterized protein n=1 Tax=Arundo donax TaxID=35708 RepID=A0A0A9HK56_ARUDO